MPPMTTIVAMSTTTTVRINLDTRDRLNRLAEQMDLSATAALDRLVREWEDEQLLRAVEALGPEDSDESREWDSTLMDGLVDENFGTWR